jgi:ubiquinone/menaquinone biosynthesis C-methylase UbiE
MNIGETAYWEERYKVEMAKILSFELFDWYCPFSAVLPMLQGIVDSDMQHKVLVIGIGRSDVIECLYQRGFRDITAIDISTTIIREMQKKYAAFVGVEFFVMDVKQLLKFSDATFTMVIDKACIDSLFCGTDFTEALKLALHEVFRVLRNDGVFLSVSHASKLSRVPYFRMIRWAIDHYLIPSTVGEHLTLYACTKTTNEELINKRVPGAEAVLQSRSSQVVSSSDQTTSKGSTTVNKANAGNITITASVAKLAELVSDVADN